MEVVNLESNFSTNRSGKGDQVRLFLKKVKRRRVKRVEADVLEKIALIFIAKYYESVIHIAVIYLWLKSGLKKFRFMVANKNICKDDT